MQAVIIEIEKPSDAKFWLDLAKKAGAKAKSLTTEQMSDVNLSNLIENGLKTKNVSRASVLKALNSNK